MNGGPEEGTWLSKVRDYSNGPVAVVHQVEPEEVRFSMNQRAKGLCSPREAGIRLSALAFPSPHSLLFILCPVFMCFSTDKESVFEISHRVWEFSPELL